MDDTVITDEIKLGDNDTLGALVANLLEADALVILTDQAGLYPYPAFLFIELKYLVHVLGEVNDDCFSYRLAGQAGSCASRKNGHAEVARDFHRSKHVFVSSRNNHAYGFDFVDAGVGAVQEAGNFIEANFAGDPLFQGFVEIFVHAPLHLAHARLSRAAPAATRRGVDSVGSGVL